MLNSAEVVDKAVDLVVTGGAAEKMSEVLAEHMMHSAMRPEGLTGTLSDREKWRLFLRSLIRGVYDEQSLRIKTGQRVLMDTLIRMGIPPGTKLEDAGVDAKKVMEDMEKSYRLVTDGLANRRRALPTPDKFKAAGIIDNYITLVMVHQYFELKKVEEATFLRIAEILPQFSFWNAWLGKIRGIGPAMGGVIMSEIDIHKTPYCSSLFKLCGIDVAPDGKGRSRRKEHLVKREYKNKKGEIELRDSITYNPFLKTKMMGVLCMSVVVHNQYFKAVYYNYRYRMEEHPVYGIHNEGKLDPVWVEKTKGMTPEQLKTNKFGKYLTSKMRREYMVKRYVVRTFLKRLYEAWKKHEGLEAKDPWEIAKLGHKPHGGEPCEICGVRTETMYGQRVCPCGNYSLDTAAKEQWKIDIAARKKAVDARRKALGIKVSGDDEDPDVSGEAATEVVA